MTVAGVGEEVLRDFGSTVSGGGTLRLLLGHRRGRDLLTLRALLDAVRGAAPGMLPAGAARRVLRDWRLLEAAERADAEAARRVVHYPFTGAWAEQCLRALATVPSGPPTGQSSGPPTGQSSGPPSGPRAPAAGADLGRLGAVAAAAAAQAGLRFVAEVPAAGGLLALPTVGGQRFAHGGASAAVARVEGFGDRLMLHAGRPSAARGPDLARPLARPVEVRRGSDGVWRSAAPGWRPSRAVRTAGGHRVLIDETDPYRGDEPAGKAGNPYRIEPSEGLDAGGHARWAAAWRDAQPWLAMAGGGRAREVDALLTCLVPLGGTATDHRSASRDEAFGAVLSSTPSSGLALAATLVHEIQHTKLLALSGLTALHTADAGARYWAPWRPDPRPFDGLLQGTFAHLALADFHLSVAPGVTSPARREEVWAEYARCRQQVAAALPQLMGARALTRHGRALVGAMADHHARISAHAPAEGHLARATAYVETARALWKRGSP